MKLPKNAALTIANANGNPPEFHRIPPEFLGIPKTPLSLKKVRKKKLRKRRLPVVPPEIAESDCPTTGGRVRRITR